MNLDVRRKTRALRFVNKVGILSVVLHWQKAKSQAMNEPSSISIGVIFKEVLGVIQCNLAWHSA